MLRLLGPDVVRVVAKEGDDVILPCHSSPKQNLENGLFDWKTDVSGETEVFLYHSGVHYNNGRLGQSEQFIGRVSHFPEQLKNGNASIMIQKAKVADSGIYECIFPHHQPETQKFSIELLVGECFH